VYIVLQTFRLRVRTLPIVSDTYIERNEIFELVPGP